jgi:hypothetical protein
MSQPRHPHYLLYANKQSTTTMAFVNTNKINDDHRFFQCDGGVIVLVADVSPEDSDTSKELLFLDEFYPDSPAFNRTRISSVGDTSLTSISTPSTVPSITKEDEFISTPIKESKHRRNRHVFASSCSLRPKQASKKGEANSTRQRRHRNRAWNETDFEAFLGFTLMPK